MDLKVILSNSTTKTNKHCKNLQFYIKLNVLCFFIWESVTCIDGSCAVDRINWSLVIPINRQMQSDGDSDVYFDVELILSK